MDHTFWCTEFDFWSDGMNSGSEVAPNDLGGIMVPVMFLGSVLDAADIAMGTNATCLAIPVLLSGRSDIRKSNRDRRHETATAILSTPKTRSDDADQLQIHLYVMSYKLCRVTIPHIQEQ